MISAKFDIDTEWACAFELGCVFRNEGDTAKRRRVIQGRGNGLTSLIADFETRTFPSYGAADA